MPAPGTARVDGLTAGETAVVTLLAEGFGYGQVAARLGITEKTARNHVYTAKERNNATTLIELFRRLGWLRVPGAD